MVDEGWIANLGGSAVRTAFGRKNADHPPMRAFWLFAMIWAACSPVQGASLDSPPCSFRYPPSTARSGGPRCLQHARASAFPEQSAGYRDGSVVAPCEPATSSVTEISLGAEWHCWPKSGPANAAFGSFFTLSKRKGTPASFRLKTARSTISGAMRESDKLLVFLSDRDLIQMINVKDRRLRAHRMPFPVSAMPSPAAATST